MAHSNEAANDGQPTRWNGISCQKLFKFPKEHCDRTFRIEECRLTIMASVEGLVSDVERLTGCSIVGLTHGSSALALVSVAVWQRGVIWTLRQQRVALEEMLHKMERKSSGVDTLEAKESEATTGVTRIPFDEKHFFGKT